MWLHFPPEWKPIDRRPAIVFFYGGGWVEGTTEQFMVHANYFAKRGMISARADYRVKSRQGTTPAEAVQDAKSAIRWLRQNATTLGIDSLHIAAAGGSSGGHIAACAAAGIGSETSTEDFSISSKPNLLVLYNPVLNVAIPAFFRLFGSPQMAQSLSPAMNLTKEFPPTLLMYGTADSLLPQGEDFWKKLQSLGIDCEMHLADGMGHGFFNQKEWHDETLIITDDYLAKHGYLFVDPQYKVDFPLRMKKYSPEIKTEKQDKAETPKSGNFQIKGKVNSPLTSARAIENRFSLKLTGALTNGTFYNLPDETFEIYVPPTSPTVPYGVLTYISPSDSGAIPWQNFTPVLDKYHLIWLGANHTGNDNSVFHRRIPIAIDGVAALQSMFKLNTKRIYVAGMSGGGRSATIAAFNYPDIFSGGIFIDGTSFWVQIPQPNNPRFTWRAGFNKPAPYFLDMALRNSRFVFISGGNDINRPQTEYYYDTIYKYICRFSTHYIIPGMGHELPTVEWMDKSVQFLDNPQPQEKNPARDKIEKELKDRFFRLTQSYDYKILEYRDSFD